MFPHRHNRELDVDPTQNPWNAFPVVLASSHLARRADRRAQLLAAGPWDVVLVDEAHHAGRRGLKASGTLNTLLALLQTMRDAESWKALYLASATPMQLDPHEAWDLIELLGLPGEWAESADKFVRYFGELAGRTRNGTGACCPGCSATSSTRRTCSSTRRSAPGSPASSARWCPGRVLRMHEPPGPTRHRVLGWKVKQGQLADDWLRAHTHAGPGVPARAGDDAPVPGAGPAARDLVMPRRTIRDAFIELSDPERALYERIDAYIGRYYNAYTDTGSGNPAARALGFIMTVYRRRLTSSFQAVRLSLQRRRHALASGRALVISDLLDVDDKTVAEDDESGTDLTAAADPIAPTCSPRRSRSSIRSSATSRRWAGRTRRRTSSTRTCRKRSPAATTASSCSPSTRHDGLPAGPARRPVSARRLLLGPRRRAVGPGHRDLEEDHQERAQKVVPRGRIPSCSAPTA